MAVFVGGVGVTACLGGLMAIWVSRSRVLQSSTEILSVADDGLKLVKDRATHAGELVSKLQSSADPIASKILRLADKTARTAEDEKELEVSAEELSERLGRVGPAVEAAASTVAELKRTSRLSRSAGLAGIGIAGDELLDQDAQESFAPLAEMPMNLKHLREKVATIRANEQIQEGSVGNLARAAHDTDEILKSVSSLLKRVRAKAFALETNLEELRTSVPAWTNWTAVIGSVFLAWMGVGQFCLLRHGRESMRTNRSA
jgi:methyl-accepting chemotaxis protein